MKNFVSAVVVLASTALQAQQFDHVEPPFWWVNMKSDSVQILFHDNDVDFGKWKVEIDYENISIRRVEHVENPHFLFVTLDIKRGTRAGILPVRFNTEKKSFTYSYELRQRSDETKRSQGFDSRDVIYLIMPDRFANGDPANDTVKGMFELADRTNPEGRHGGDLKGIANHLNYIQDIGATAIWLTPVLENNQRKTSYHGYSITDLYNIDARFGGNAAYLDFVNQAHAHNLKVVKDMVINHLGSEHWLMKDLPQKRWIHQFPEFTRTNYQGNVPSDPHASMADTKNLTDGWFDITMPDLDQKNPLLATYLIQNTLWWIEYSGIDGIRMDTYPYPDKSFMSRWSKAVMEEFPSFNIVGEVWLNNSIPATAYWQKGMINTDGYKSNLPSVTDFPLCFTVAQALNETGGYETGLRRLYILLSQDFIYPDANRNVVFLDNHDMTRFYLSVGRDLSKFKLGMIFLLTTRGIPVLYYGSELLMDGDGGYHPNVRRDFPGGWSSDQASAFRGILSPDQDEAFRFLKTILQWRKKNPAFQAGKLIHFIPHDNVYVYFRVGDNSVTMVALNGNENSASLSLGRFAELLNGFQQGTEVLSDQKISVSEPITVPKNSGVIIDFHR